MIVNRDQKWPANLDETKEKGLLKTEKDWDEKKKENLVNILQSGPFIDVSG